MLVWSLYTCCQTTLSTCSEETRYRTYCFAHVWNSVLPLACRNDSSVIAVLIPRRPHLLSFLYVCCFLCYYVQVVLFCGLVPSCGCNDVDSSIPVLRLSHIVCGLLRAFCFSPRTMNFLEWTISCFVWELCKIVLNCCLMSRATLGIRVTEWKIHPFVNQH